MSEEFMNDELFSELLDSVREGGDIAIREYDGREVHVVFKETEEDSYLVFTVIKPRIRHR